MNRKADAPSLPDPQARFELGDRRLALGADRLVHLATLRHGVTEGGQVADRSTSMVSDWESSILAGNKSLSDKEPTAAFAAQQFAAVQQCAH